MLTEFHFLRPEWLLALLPLVAFLYWFARRRFATHQWRDVVDPQLMPHVLIGADYKARRGVSGWLALAGVLLIVALAGPAWQRLPQPVFRSQDALVIALDLSRSMDVADVSPSRLGRARFKINDILRRRAEGQSALIIYAAEPYVVSPLTDDTRTIITQLPALETSMMPSQGSRGDRALSKAGELLRQAGVAGGQVLLVTDGVNDERTAGVASDLRAEGIRVSVLGVGTEDGGPIPGPGGFIKRADGGIVIAKLDVSAIEDVASQGGGRYRSLAADDSDIERLLADVDPDAATTEATGLEADVWREEGPWLLLPLLPLVALAFRRGVLAIWLLVFILPPQPAEAVEWSDLWLRSDQRAERLLEAGDAAGAAALFEDPAWKSAAAYRAGQFADSAATLEGLDDIESTYNRGNALAKLGRYDEAIAAYDDVLERNPEHNDARYNRELVRQQQQNQQQQDQEQQQAGETSEDQQEQQGEQSQDGEQQQQGQQAQDQQAQNQQAQEGDQSQDQGEDQRSADAGQDPQQSDESNATAAELERWNDQAAEQPTDTSQLADAETLDEESQATEQWLRTIPDDPGGLLRRKFYYQYQQQGGERQEEDQW